MDIRGIATDLLIRTASRQDALANRLCPLVSGLTSEHVAPSEAIRDLILFPLALPLALGSSACTEVASYLSGANTPPPAQEMIDKPDLSNGI